MLAGGGGSHATGVGNADGEPRGAPLLCNPLMNGDQDVAGLGVRVDEAVFLGGVDKSEILAGMRPRIYFDDQMSHLERARLHRPSAHVFSTEDVQDQLFEEPEPPAVEPQAVEPPSTARLAPVT